MSTSISAATSHSLQSEVNPSGNSHPSVSTPSISSNRRRTPSTSSKGGMITTDDDEDHDEYLEGDELDDDDEADHDPDQVDSLDEATVKSGYLWKKGEKRKNWKKRWFVLRSSKLAYYKNEKEYQLLRLLDMSEVHTVASVALKKNENAFGIVTPKRTYYVKASSKSEMLSWIENLMNVKTQVQMRSTLTQELAAADIAGATTTSPNPIPPTKPSRSQSKERSPNVSESSAEGAPSSSRPMSVTIPGQGTYVSPAQPRPIPSPGALSIPNNKTGSSTLSPTGSAQAFSPLTSTTVSGSSGGSDYGAEQYGLSYQSSGFSAGSSPTRATASDVNNLSHSPQSTGETSDGSRGIRSNSKSRNRSRQEGSSEGGGDRPASPSRGKSKTGGYFASAGTGVQHATTPGAAGALSSSDEEGDDGDGEDWDEDEVADQAMPLPGLIPGPTSTSSQQQPPQNPQAHQSTSNSIQPSPNTQVRTIVQPPSQLKDPSKIIMQGYLMKQSNRRKHWRKRWFVLNGKDLTYSRSHMDSKNNRQIPLSSILDAIEYTSKKASAIGNHASPISPSLASPTTAHQSFNFGSAIGGHHEDSVGEKNAAGNERENMHQVEKSLGEEKDNSSANPNIKSPQPQKSERRTSLVAAAANIGERLGSVASNPKSSDSNYHTSNFSTSPNLGGTSPLPSSSLQTPKKKKENCFKIITPKRTFVVCAPTEEEEIKWLGAIQALLTRSRGSTTTTFANSNPPATQTTGFTLSMPNKQGAPNEIPTSNEASNKPSGTQNQTQIAPSASSVEEEASLPKP